MSSVALGFVMGSLRANASYEEFRIIEASFSSSENESEFPIGNRALISRDSAALPDVDPGFGDIVRLQNHMKNVQEGAGLDPDILVPAIGLLKSEILELRVLFKRLADVAELYDGEFDLDFDAVLGAPEDASSLQTPGEPTTLESPSHQPEQSSQSQHQPSNSTAQPSVIETAKELVLSIAQLDHISEQTERMKSIFLDRSSAHDRQITGWPLQGGRVTSRFGHRVHPISGARQLHRGMDFSAGIGTPVLAMADGIVAFSGRNGSYGNLVELEHGDGYRTRYAHNDSNTVIAGQRVLKGQQIATLGSTGRSTGPHVHVEVRRHGTPIDPAIFLR